MAILADLLVRFGADSAELRKTLKTVESDLNKFTRDIGGMKKALQGAFAVTGIAVAAKALSDFVRGGTNAADEIGKLSKKVGVSAEELSRLGYAASLSGSNIDGVATGLRNLSKEMAGAQAGSKASAALFREIGVSVTDSAGALRPMGDVLRDVADKFAGWEDGAAKAAIAQELFGKSGLDLIPFLNEGSAGLARLGAESDRTGNTITHGAAKSAEAFNDSLERMGAFVSGAARQLAAEFTPMLTELAAQFTENERSANAYKSVITGVAGALKTVATVALAVSLPLQQAAAGLASLAKVASQIKNGDLAGAWETYQEGVRNQLTVIETTFAAIGKLWEGSGGLVGKLSRQGAPPPVLKHLAGGAKEAKDELAPLKKLLADLEGDVATFGKGDVEVLRFRLESGDLRDELAKAGPLATAYRDAILDAADALEVLKRKTDAHQVSMQQFNETVAAAGAVYEETRTPAERYAAELERLDGLLQATAIDQETYNRAVGALVVEYDRGTQAAIEMSGAAVSGLRQMVTATGDFSERVKGFFAGMLESFLSILETMLAEWIKTQIIMAAVNAFGGSWSDTMPKGGTDYFGIQGFMADGGSVRGGAAYVVGEEGPELFVPGTSGKIIPNDEIGAGGPTVEAHIYVQGDVVDPEDWFRRNRAAMGAAIGELAYTGRI